MSNQGHQGKLSALDFPSETKIYIQQLHFVQMSIAHLLEKNI